MGAPTISRQPSVAIVLTLSHKSTYTPDEELAFRHVRRHLGRYDTFALMPQSHPAAYPGLIPKRFPDRFFGSAKAHGALLLSEGFYRAFADYEFILIHHLDALVFSDQLAAWCDAGYDYIGAPWLISPQTPHITEQKVGNGGLSLRRVASFQRVLTSRRYFVDPDDYWRGYRERTPNPLTRVLNLPRRFLKRVPALNDIHWHIRWALRGDVHEDRFWAEYATHYDPSFCIAPVEIAMRFAFEAEPRACYERIGRQLPFGAHRWAQFEREFFTPLLLNNGPGSDVRLPGTSDANGTLDFAAAYGRRAARRDSVVSR